MIRRLADLAIDARIGVLVSVIINILSLSLPASSVPMSVSNVLVSRSHTCSNDAATLCRFLATFDFLAKLSSISSVIDFQRDQIVSLLIDNSYVTQCGNMFQQFCLRLCNLLPNHECNCILARTT